MAISKQAGYALWIAIVIAILLTILISMLIHLIVYNPIEKKKGSLNILMISSIGVMIIGINTIALIFGNETQILNLDLSKTFHIGQIVITHNQLLQLTVGISILVFFLLLLKFSQFGIKTRALRDNPELCNIYQMNVPVFKLKLYALSGFFISIAGILMAWDIGVNPYIGMPMFLNAIVALIIGGIGKFLAPILGGIIIGLLQSLVVWQFSSNWQEAVTFTVLILFLLLRPQGIFGEKIREV
jgi:branched-chain amino acid transport system permease protein